MSKRKSKRIKGPKAANGKGSVLQRKDGRWMARWPALDPMTGKRKRYTIYARTDEFGVRHTFQNETDALAGLADVLYNPQSRALTAGGPEPTLATYVKQWLSISTVRTKTKYRYAELLNHHILPTLGDTKLTALEATHIRALMVRKHEGGLSARTCNHMRAVLRNVLNDAMRETGSRGRSKYGITRNVAGDAKPLKDQAVEEGYLTAPQARTLLDIAASDPDGPAWTLALTTGLRQSELLGLRWADVDMDAPSLRVVRGVQRHPNAGTWLVEDPKSTTGRRTVPLTNLAVVALQRQRSLQAAARLAVGKRWKPVLLTDTEANGRVVFSDLVFTNTTGGPLSGYLVTKRFQAALKGAGLPAIKFHGLRHSAITMLLDDVGQPIKTVQMIAGHANAATTLKYAHAAEASKRDAATALNAKLSG